MVDRREEDSPYTSIRGSFGQFEPVNSKTLNLIQYVIPMKNIEWLETASEAFTPESFDELIQRDIVEIRVKEIFDTYLNNDSPGVRFFPPLIVSIVPHKSSGSRLADNTYGLSSSKLTNSEKDIVSEWGPGLFRLSVGVQEGSTNNLYQVLLDLSLIHI